MSLLPSSPSLQDLTSGVDLTGAVSVTATQLMALVNAGVPFNDKGLILTTIDNVDGTPVIPDAVTNTKWQRYLWRRITSTATIIYAWNPNIASGPYQNWIQVFTTANANTGGFDPSTIADGSIPGSKIASLSYAQLTGIPVALPPSGAAGGSLTGSYPNPTLDTTKQSVVPAMLNITGGSPRQVVRVNDANTAGEFAFQGVIQKISQLINASSGGPLPKTVTGTAGTDGNPTTGQGVQVFIQSFTPKCATSVIKVSCAGYLGITSGGTAKAQLALFVNGVLQNVTQAISNTNFAGNHSGYVECYINSWGAGVAQNVQAYLSTTDITKAAIFGLQYGQITFTVEEFING